MEGTFDFTTALANDIVGQKRTGKAKQFVFIQGDYAIKGPYQQGRLNNVITRSQIFAAWNTPTVVKAIDYFTTKDGIFVRFPNIMKDYQLEYDLYFETFSGLQYKVLKNAPVLDIGHALPTNPWITNEAEDVILALCHCNILGVGDMNARNTLVDVKTHQFYIIDFDDNLGADRDDEVFYFNKVPGKKLRWYELVSHHYNAVADRLIPLLTDATVINNNLVPRVERAINLLRRFFRTGVIDRALTIPDTGANQRKMIRSPAILDVNALTTGMQTLTLQPTQTVPTPKPRTPKTPKQPAILQIPGPIQMQPQVPTLQMAQQGLTLNIQQTQPQRKIGQMIWKGLRGGASKTYSGIDFDVAKSALQKYIRRNMPQKAIMSAVELYRMGEVGGDPGVTNTYNRLAIIANEDIGPANLPLVLEVTRLVEGGDRDLARLVAMVQLMAGSPKTRMMSHAWRAYAHPEGRAVSTRLGLPIDIAFTDSDLQYINENKNSDLFLPSDPENIRPYILVFLKRLYEKDFNAFTWAYFFLETAKDLTLVKRKKFVNGNTRSTTGKSDILLWKALAKILPPETHNILVEAYYNHTESRPFLQNAILVALYGLPYSKFDIEPAADIWRQQPSLQQMLNGDFTLEIDPFVIDKHTRKGRSMGMGIQEFVDEGAAVTPQDPNFYNETLETIYRNR